MANKKMTSKELAIRLNNIRWKLYEIMEIVNNADKQLPQHLVEQISKIAGGQAQADLGSLVEELFPAIGSPGTMIRNKKTGAMLCAVNEEVYIWANGEKSFENALASGARFFARALPGKNICWCKNLGDYEKA